jgi:hypothetical protein
VVCCDWRLRVQKSSFAPFENERFPNSGIFSADVHAARFRPHFFLFSADSHFGCFMFLFLRDRLRVTSEGEMEKLASDGILIEKRGRVLEIWEYPEFSIKRNRGIVFLLTVFLLKKRQKSKHEIPYQSTVGSDCRQFELSSLLEAKSPAETFTATLTSLAILFRLQGPRRALCAIRSHSAVES